MDCDFNEKESIAFCDGPCKPCNVRRAEKAAGILDHIETEYRTEEKETDITDFLADLMHYASQTSNLDLDVAFASAHRHFEEEKV